MYVSRLRTAAMFQFAVVPAPQQGAFAARAASALIFVIDTSVAPRSRSPLMCQLSAMTPTEARVADLLLQGLDMRETADRLRSSLATARFHLKRVFVKTRTHRQSALMGLMLSLPGETEQKELVRG